MVVITQVTMACIMALLLGAIYFQQGLSQASIQSRVGAISFSMLLMSFIAFDIVLLFPKERDLYTRESQAGLYDASAFFHARCLAELPGHLTAGGAYATICVSLSRHRGPGFGSNLDTISERYTRPTGASRTSRKPRETPD